MDWDHISVLQFPHQSLAVIEFVDRSKHVRFYDCCDTHSNFSELFLATNVSSSVPFIYLKCILRNYAYVSEVKLSPFRILVPAASDLIQDRKRIGKTDIPRGRYRLLIYFESCLTLPRCITRRTIYGVFISQTVYGLFLFFFFIFPPLRARFWSEGFEWCGKCKMTVILNQDGAVVTSVHPYSRGWHF